jgi:hypothetical protein
MVAAWAPFGGSEPVNGEATPAITLGLIAHDPQKEALARFVRAHRDIVGRIRFWAPEDTADPLAQLPLHMDVLAPTRWGATCSWPRPWWRAVWMR